MFPYLADLAKELGADPIQDRNAIIFLKAQHVDGVMRFSFGEFNSGSVAGRRFDIKAIHQGSLWRMARCDK